VYVARHGKNAKSLLARHASYLTRDKASPEAEKTQAYSANRDNLDLKQEVKAWADDRHHFRVIISPEKAHEISDLNDYIRRLMATVERDLDTKLQWFAVDHRNTSHHHTHVLVRGRKPDGTDLVIPRDYIAHGIRDRASELATRLLGRRSDREIQQALERDAVASRMTKLDWVLDRVADSKRVVHVQEAARASGTLTDGALLEKRLAYLRSLGLVEHVGGRRWRLSQDLTASLKVMGRANDIIKNLHADRGATRKIENNQLTVYGPRDLPGQALVGRVVDRGGHEEQLRDLEFLLVKADNGQLHYVPIRATASLKHIGRGSLVAVEPGSRGGTRVRPLGDHPLKQQVKADAYTWLDRQVYRQRAGKDSPVDAYTPVQKAAAMRSAWLVERGYATQRGAELRWKPGVVVKLMDQELRAAADTVAQKLGCPARWVSSGEKTHVTGRLRGSLPLHMGRHLVVQTASEAVLVPLRGASVTRDGESVRVTLGEDGSKRLEKQRRARAAGFRVNGQDLKDPKRLMHLYKDAVERGLVGGGEPDRLKFFAAAQYVYRTKSKNPPALFHWIVTHGKWDRVRGVDEDRASQRVKQQLYGRSRRASSGRGATKRRGGHEHIDLSADARLVATVNKRLAGVGYKGDPYEALKRKKPSFTRERWDKALLELTEAQAKRQKARSAASPLATKVSQSDVRGILKTAGIRPIAVGEPKRPGGRERGD
jgi:type IV secretory pathway VirD2 relaxase